MTKVTQILTNEQWLKEIFTVPPGGGIQFDFVKPEKEVTHEATPSSTAPQQDREVYEQNEGDKELKLEPSPDFHPGQTVELLADDIEFEDVPKDNSYLSNKNTEAPYETDEGYQSSEEGNFEYSTKDSFTFSTTFKPYFIPETPEPKPASCPFSPKALDASDLEIEQARTGDRHSEGVFVQQPYIYDLDPFCLTRHHIFIPALPVILPQWCFVPDTPDFMCPRYDLGFHIAFPHETQRDMYYRCVYGQAELRRCPNLHYWDDERKICTMMTDFNPYHHRHHHHNPRQSLYDSAAHHHCQQCRRNFLLPQDLDPSAQCSDRILLACNTDGTLSVYECPVFYHHDRHVQLRWYADLERCDYPADGDGPWRR
uniref:Chitin-binding type-2 domain-containing protein n=1 Tax=Anopheles christyi TaxID=43041 RepID=A0A182K2M5_9DIPT